MPEYVTPRGVRVNVEEDVAASLGYEPTEAKAAPEKKSTKRRTPKADDE